MKKTAALLVCISMLLSLSACNLFCSHEWLDATCTSPRTCSLCGKTEGSATTHTWRDATCTSPKTCTLCDQTDGSTAAHTWQNATCTSPKTCSACRKTSGDALGHSYQSGYCSRCRAQEPIKTISWQNVLAKTPNQLSIQLKSGSGVVFRWNHDYIGNKRIHYIWITFELYDAVGNPVNDDIKHQSVHICRFIGPFDVGKPIEIYSGVMFYSKLWSKIVISNMIFEYEGGTMEQINCNWSVSRT